MPELAPVMAMAWTSPHLGISLTISFENLVSSHGYAPKSLRWVILCREADCSGFEFKYI